MPIEVSWYLADHILWTQYSGEVTLDEVRTSYRELVRLSAESPETVIHTLVDVRKATKLPLNLGAFQKIVREEVPQVQQSVPGWVILIGDNQFFSFMATVINSVMKTRFRHVTTLEDGLRIIIRHDANFPHDALKT